MTLPKKTVHIAAVLSAFFLCAALSGCGLFPQEEEALSPPMVKAYQSAQINVATAQIMDLQKYVDIHVTYLPVKTEDLSFGVSGYLYADFSVRAGMTVKQGDQLGTLDCTDLDGQIENLQSQLGDNQTRQDNLKALEVLDEKAAALQGQDSLASTKAYYAQTFSDLNIQASILQTQLDLLNTRRQARVLVAGMDGVITYVRSVKLGDLSSKGATMVTISDSSASIFSAMSPNAKNLAAGMKVNVTVDKTDYPATVVTAESIGVANPVDIAAYVALDEPNTAITQNTSGNIHLLVQESDNALAVPMKAVHTSRGQSFVYLYNDSLKTVQEVTTGMDDGLNIEITSGLKEGDTVIVGGGQQ